MRTIETTGISWREVVIITLMGALAIVLPLLATFLSMSNNP